MGQTDHRWIITHRPPNRGPGCEDHAQERRGARESWGRPPWVQTQSLANQARSRHEPGKKGRERHSPRREQQGPTVEGGTASGRNGEKSERRAGGKLHLHRPGSCLFPQENQPQPALPVRTLSPWPPASSQLPTSPGQAASSHSPADPTHCRGSPPTPAHGGTKPSVGGGWDGWVLSGITQPIKDEVTLSTASRHPLQ